MLDVPRLIGEVTARHGIRLEPNDPAFALVTLNQLILEETATRLTENVSSILTQFSGSLNKTERRVGAILAQDLKSAITEIRSHLRIEPEAQSRNILVPPTLLKTVEYGWAALGLLAAMLIFGIGIAVGTVIAGR
ncbi:MAG TPA: hypothetical protein VHZ55_17390 [Bryobacteraceae bacterium]|jgi:hypothetical protein|nr:hypothetical protein [Bryobacteraceae bacterium]